MFARAANAIACASATEEAGYFMHNMHMYINVGASSLLLHALVCGDVCLQCLP